MGNAIPGGIQYTLTSQGLFQEQTRPVFRDGPSSLRDFNGIALARRFSVCTY